MNHQFDELVSKVKRECENNYVQVQRRFEFLKSIKNNKEHKQTIAMSSMLSHTETIRAWQTGIDQYLNKTI